MDKKIIARILSVMTLFFFGALFLPMILAIIMNDKIGGAAFSLILLIALIISFELRNYSKKTDANANVTIKESIAVTIVGWFIIALLGTLPYYLSGALKPIDAFLESVSGFAGVGGSAAETIEAFSPAILLWRSLTNWMGGLGIVLLFMALMPQKGAAFMIKAENAANGERQLPRMRDNAKAILAIYFILTLFCALVFIILGADVFSAVNHAMTTIATGGYSVFDEGLSAYHNRAIEFAAAVFMIIASISFSVYLSAIKGNFTPLFKSTEIKVFFSIIIIATTIISLDLFLNNDEKLFMSIHLAFFHVASLISTTAFAISDFDTWPPLSKGLLLFLMFIGGCAGSTAGGLKIFRLVLLCKMIGVILRQKLHPYQIINAKINGKVAPDEIFFGAGRFFFATIVIDVIFAALMILNGVDIDNATLISISTMSSVGPGFGIEGAMSNYSLLPDFSKIFAVFVMILGRLEIFTVLVFFTRDFWRKKW